MGAIDEKLMKCHPQVEKHAVRYVDDMVFYAGSIAEAQSALGTYEVTLADFGLALNPQKVSISDDLAPPSSPWVPLLRQARYRDDDDRRQASDVMDIFDLALHQSRIYPTEGVLKYAVLRCNPFPAGERGWPVYRDILLAVAKLEPSTLPAVYDMLHNSIRFKLPIDRGMVEGVLGEMLDHHASLDHGFEVSWIMSIFILLGLPIDSRGAKRVITMDDNLSNLLMMTFYSRQRRLSRTVDINPLVRRAERDGALSSSDWLLAYEMRRSKSCRPRKWDGSAAWEELARREVSFLQDPPARLRRFRRAPTFWGSPI